MRLVINETEIEQDIWSEFLGLKGYRKSNRFPSVMIDSFVRPKHVRTYSTPCRWTLNWLSVKSLKAKLVCAHNSQFERQVVSAKRGHCSCHSLSVEPEQQVSGLIQQLHRSFFEGSALDSRRKSNNILFEGVTVYGTVQISNLYCITVLETFQKTSAMGQPLLDGLCRHRLSELPNDR